MQIAVIDLGTGNLRSVAQALGSAASAADIAADIIVTADPAIIGSADKVVLPGQGAIGSWLASLLTLGLKETILQALNEKPMLGICIGMQALFSHCEEDGGVEGLGIFDGSVRHFCNFHPLLKQQRNKLKVPHMGWNSVRQSNPHPLWQGVVDNAYFYFVHSYCTNLNRQADQHQIFGTTDYGHEFVAAIGRDNLFAVQFHPEKSHKDGLQLLQNFTRWNGVL